jgi:hypothetical protein
LADLSVNVFHSALDEQFIAQTQPLEAWSSFSGAKGAEAWMTQIRRARIRGHGRNKLRTT